MRTQKTWIGNRGHFAVAAVVVTLILFSNSGCRQSTPIPAEIVGDSMAPGLCGESFLQTCSECEFQFKSGVADCPDSILCPNCEAEFPTSTLKRPADAVNVVPNRRLNRWDIVAIRQHKKRLIKRVVGLPGETIELIGGNVFANGSLIVRPESVTEELKILVFDSNFQRPSFSPFEFEAKCWTQTKNNWTHAPHDSKSVDLIGYRPVVDDRDSYNQNVSRHLHVVEELVIETELSLTEGSEFVMHRLIAGISYTSSISFQSQPPQIKGTFSDGANEQNFATPLKRSANDQPVRFSFSNIDGTIWLKANGSTLLKTKTKVQKSASQDRQSTKPTIQFGFRGSSTGSVDRCRIWRDVYYYAEDGLPKFRLPSELGDGEYFVLGDNVPVSRDSRHFGPVKEIIGVVEK